MITAFDFYHNLLTDEFSYPELNDRINLFYDMVDEEWSDYLSDKRNNHPYRDKAIDFLSKELMDYNEPRTIIEHLLEEFSL